jgi:hypothetical protein
MRVFPQLGAGIPTLAQASHLSSSFTVVSP